FLRPGPGIAVGTGAHHARAQMTNDVLRSERVGSVELLTMNRPDQLNALNLSLITALTDAIARLVESGDVRAVVLTGEGKAFAAGADIKEFAAFEAAGFRDFITRLEGVCSGFEALPQPVIAAVAGVAFGGGFELALGCDLIIADERARFGLPEIKLGLLPGAGGTQRAPRAVPVPVAKRMLFTGEPIDAPTAHRFGLVAEIAPAEQVIEVAIARAERLAVGPARSLAAAKRLVHSGLEVDLATAIDLECAIVTAFFDRSDLDEGVIS